MFKLFKSSFKFRAKLGHGKVITEVLPRSFKVIINILPKYCLCITKWSIVKFMKFVGKREGAGGAITRGCVGAGVGGSDGGEW